MDALLWANASIGSAEPVDEMAETVLVTGAGFAGDRR
jgi:hypothetical protein